MYGNEGDSPWGSDSVNFPNTLPYWIWSDDNVNINNVGIRFKLNLYGKLLIQYTCDNIVEELYVNGYLVDTTEKSK